MSEPPRFATTLPGPACGGMGTQGNFDPALKRFYQRLLEKGKTKMTALVAAMRKLLTIINTMIAKGENWNPKLS